MKKYNIALAIGIFCSFQISCNQEKAEAKKQIVDTIDIPEYPIDSEGVYNLNPSKNTVGYAGTIVLLNQKAKPQDIADLLQASIDSRVAWGKIKQYTEDVNYERLFGSDGVYPLAIKDLQTELVQFTRELKLKNPPDEETLANTANTWWSTELDLLHGTEDSPQKQAANALFEQYCEAKIWELATNSNFAQTNYYKRPTPMAFCEPYYAAQNYFSTDVESCADAPDTGKNYFSCLWHEGMVKGKVFAELPEDQRTDILDLLDPSKVEAFRGVLAVDTSILIFPPGPRGELIKNIILGEGRDKKNFFSTIILSQSSDRSCTRIVDSSVRALCSAFNRSYSGDIESSLPLKKAPGAIITSFENNGVFSPRPNSTFTTEQVLHLIGRRFNYSHRNSESDRLYHQVASGPALESPEIDSNTVSVEDRKSIEGYFAIAGFFYPPLSERDQKIYEKKEKSIRFLQSQIEAVEREYSRLNDQITATSFKGFEVGHRSNLAHAMLEGRFKITNHENMLRAYFSIKTFEDKHTVIGCFNLNTGTSPEPNNCGAHPDDGVNAENTSVASLFRVNEQTGLVEFEFKFVDPENMGFKKTDRVGKEGEVTAQQEGEDGEKYGPFNDFEASYFQDKTFYLELFPNKIYEHLEILSGKGFIREGGVDVEEAAISFWDQNQ